MTDMLDALEYDRKALRLNQEQMGRILGISQGYYSRLVARKVRLTRQVANSIELVCRREPDKYLFLRPLFFS